MSDLKHTFDKEEKPLLMGDGKGNVVGVVGASSRVKIGGTLAGPSPHLFTVLLDNLEVGRFLTRDYADLFAEALETHLQKPGNS